MKALKQLRGGFAGIVVFILLLAGISAEAELRIEKAYCGANGSWCDVTAFLQNKVNGDTLSTRISQPYRDMVLPSLRLSGPFPFRFSCEN